MRAWKTLARRVVYSYLPWMEVAVEKIELPDGRVIDEYLAVRTPLKIEVERVRQAADPVALDVRLRGHLHMSDVDFDDHPTFVFWVRDGKLARYEGHVDPAAIEEATARSDPDDG